MDWSRLYGTVSDFTEAAGADWPTWTNVQYDSPGALSAEFAFKVPAHVLEPDKFLPAKTARTLVYDRWQRLSSIGWKAELKPLAQQALPSDLAPDKLSEIVSYPGGLWALPLSVTDQSLVFLLDSPGSPTATDALPWVELTTPVVVKSSGPSFTFSFGGVMYVKK